MKTLILIIESFRFAWQGLKANLLRTLLSLLGVAIGIFAIIAVFTVVDSLEKSIKNSMSFLGDRVLYVQKWPWTFGSEYPWWKYMRWPRPGFKEFKFLEQKLENHDGIAIFAAKGDVILKYKNNSAGKASIQGVSYSFNKISDVSIAQGRYFTPEEIRSSKNAAIIGDRIAADLFGTEKTAQIFFSQRRKDRKVFFSLRSLRLGEKSFFSPGIGKNIKIKGRKFTIIGIMEKQGSNFLDTPSNDDNCLIPYNALTKIYSSRKRGGIQSSIAIKGKQDDKGLFELENELTGLMRSIRGLKPRQENNFAINRSEMLTNIIAATFNVIGAAGWVIGGFAILIGGFGIANIMFVSVKERTHIIGIQKSLGAMNFFILSQFLFEAVFLSVIGGMMGIFLVYTLTLIPQDKLELLLSFNNMLWGIAISASIGIVAGIAPAIVASRMNPVDAIRAN